MDPELNAKLQEIPVQPSNQTSGEVAMGQSRAVLTAAEHNLTTVLNQVASLTDTYPLPHLEDALTSGLVLMRQELEKLNG